MKSFAHALLALLSLMLAVPRADAAPMPNPLILCWHDVQPADPDQIYLGVTTEKLVEQLSWLVREGFVAIRLDDLVAAREGRKPLPEKAVLLTFDDGYRSFYTEVFPVLQAFRMPAVLALVGDWMEGEEGGQVLYGDRKAPRELFMSWAQVREVAASGLVEVAAHSNGLHFGAGANPQGNKEPAVVTRRFDAAGKNYEGEGTYRARLEADSSAISNVIERRIGKRPRAMVWPYGEYSQLAIQAAAKSGMPITLTLGDPTRSGTDLSALPRQLVANDPNLGQLVSEVRSTTFAQPIRVMHVDLDYVYDADPAQQERNLDALVKRVHDFAINTVYLQAFADPEASGLVRSVYFPNRLLPMRADLMNRVAWQLRTRAKVHVYGWMPVLAFAFPQGGQPVTAFDPNTGKDAVEPKGYRRLSPFDADNRKRILDLYEDLGKAVPIDGLLFHDDALMSDFEDASPPALAAYAAAGLPASIDAIRKDPATMARWTAFKTQALISFTHELADRVKLNRRPLKTARNMYARPLVDARSSEWFAQDLDSFLAAYDYTAVMAMPDMEGIDNEESDAWLRMLVERVARSGGLRKTVFELQAVDWRQGGGDPDRRIPSAELAHQMTLLSRLGATNFGYYPDDFVANHPDADVLHPAFSLQSYPYLP